MAKKYTCCAVCVTYTCSADQFNTHLVSSVVKSTFISVLTNECYFSMDECPVFRGRDIKILKKKKKYKKGRKKEEDYNTLRLHQDIHSLRKNVYN